MRPIRVLLIVAIIAAVMAHLPYIVSAKPANVVQPLNEA